MTSTPPVFSLSQSAWLGDPARGEVDPIIVIVTGVDHVSGRKGRDRDDGGDKGKRRTHPDSAGKSQTRARFLTEQAEEFEGRDRRKVGELQIVVVGTTDPIETVVLSVILDEGLPPSR